MEAKIVQFNRRINYLITETDAVYHEMARRLGLADSEMLILYALTDMGGSCPLASLYRQTGLSKQTVNSALRKLEKSGDVFLRPADRKSKIVCLSETGQALAARTAGRVLAAENEIYAAWPAEDLETYLQLNTRYLEELREKLKEFGEKPL